MMRLFDVEEIKVHLDKVLKSRNITSKELAEKIGITEANLSILKTGKAKGVRFNTLMSICRELDCQPGDILEYRRDYDESDKGFGSGFVIWTVIGLWHYLRSYL